MRYHIAARLAAPAAITPMRRYRRFSTANLMTGFLVPGSRMARSDGACAVLDGRTVTVHEHGAHLALHLEAPTLAFAEHAARSLVTILVRDFRELTGWSVASCAATITEDEFGALMGSLDSSR
ncbi:hypothetical protein CLV63_11883 [Murinocardiopsis flavida]|uniref:Uncharacterized protein n=1 Tax=Murinocardiopsis flavida TaxID=645275 RepID=A0A2P8D527_9ACTN|nr:hypothetical protein [Murinocardiopsis flavida]PSK92324.1 hypothetical protein CLV63_11883 [Murinocardiopsis flavida]